MLQEQVSPYWRTVMERLEIAKNAECTEHTESVVSFFYDAGEAFCAFRRQICVSENEQIILPSETDDPLGAHCYQVGGDAIGGRLVHQYKNRCLFLVTGKCFAHCRYCFRRESSVLGLPFVCEIEVAAMCAYIGNHREVKEIILTGGDPLTVSDKHLEDLFGQIRNVRSDILIRVGTRAPVFAPERITDNLVQLLRTFRPLWLIPHINHPTEISARFAPEARYALQSLIDGGIPMQSQTVLLHGVNDNVSLLACLFQDLASLGVRPGYLFQGDMAQGTSHFRVPLEDGIALYKDLRSELSGLSTPVYAVDLPDGGGKVNLLQLTDAQFNLLKELYTK